MKNTPAISYQRIPVRELRALPIRENPRLKILDYRLTSAPGMVRRPRTHGHGSAVLAGGFVLAICLTRGDGGQWFLETERRCFDQQAAARTKTPPLSPALLADVYRGLQRRQVLLNARQNAQKRRN